MADRTAATRIRRHRGLAALLLALPMLPAPLLPPPAVAQEAVMNAPDLSGVTTEKVARRLVREGRLVEITLFPIELGGPDDPMNVSWTTPEAANIRDMVIGTFGRFFEQDLIDRLKVAPDYKGDSIVPGRIVMTGTHSKLEGEIALTIEVW